MLRWPISRLECYVRRHARWMHFWQKRATNNPFLVATSSRFCSADGLTVIFSAEERRLRTRKWGNPQAENIFTLFRGTIKKKKIFRQKSTNNFLFRWQFLIRKKIRNMTSTYNFFSNFVNSQKKWSKTIFDFQYRFQILVKRAVAQSKNALKVNLFSVNILLFSGNARAQKQSIKIRQLKNHDYVVIKIVCNRQIEMENNYMFSHSIIHLHFATSISLRFDLFSPSRQRKLEVHWKLCRIQQSFKIERNKKLELNSNSLQLSYFLPLQIACWSKSNWFQKSASISTSTRKRLQWARTRARDEHFSFFSSASIFFFSSSFSPLLLFRFSPFRFFLVAVLIATKRREKQRRPFVDSLLEESERFSFAFASRSHSYVVVTQLPPQTEHFFFNWLQFFVRLLFVFFFCPFRARTSTHICSRDRSMSLTVHLRTFIHLLIDCPRSSRFLHSHERVRMRAPILLSRHFLRLDVKSNWSQATYKMRMHLHHETNLHIRIRIRCKIFMTDPLNQTKLLRPRRHHSNRTQKRWIRFNFHSRRHDLARASSLSNGRMCFTHNRCK